MKTQDMEHNRKGAIIAEGKTKRIHKVLGRPGLVIVESKDDITAGDGEKHDVIKNKAELSTATTCNVFSLLRHCGLPVAFEDQLNPKEFLAPALDMIQLEVVGRRVATGSYLQRNPHVPNGTVFPRLVTEFYLKTHGCEFNGHKFPKSTPGKSYDDPYMKIVGEEVWLYNAHIPLATQEPFLKLPLIEIFPKNNGEEVMARMAALNTLAFLIIEKAWKILGYDMLDWKIEFGWYNDTLCIGDVIDADSWRVMKDGQKLSKQAYRDNEGLTVMEKVLRRTATLTGCFRIPEQSLVVWSGSPNDDTNPFMTAFKLFTDSGIPGLNIHCFVRSAHKETIQSAFMLQDMEFGCKGLGDSTPLPDPVIVTNVGRSNGLGPMCAANSMVPVISTVPDPVDVNSSLRMPSDVPLMVVTDPKLAVQAALKILAGRNPLLWALLRLKQEERTTNAILLP
ncbi:MAG: phosphoribosylaminoimidazolesuccinocarboxamide synthase [Candidatus Staskawiczbacteria bacterium]|jgi:phosphoribosylaminoimidazole carboxylase/phosphoribosylaminoimidazole-succinocarboxamide synthase